MRIKTFRNRVLLGLTVSCLILLFSGGRVTESADHSDTPLLTSIPRHDARLTDLFAFRDKNDLIVALCADPTVPAGVSQYAFQTDVVFEINIDNSSRVSYADQTANETYGGTIEHPGSIEPDIKFTITFDESGARLDTSGIKGNTKGIELFTGLRDDPFIRGPRTGRNVAAMILKIPLHMVKRSQKELLIWAASRVPDIGGAQGDMAGRALRTMFDENMALNYMPPDQHTEMLGVPPDVIIYDISRPARYPNGRTLADDVVDLVGDYRVLGNDSPFPTANDVPFLTDFPYLAPPQ